MGAVIHQTEKLIIVQKMEFGLLSIIPADIQSAEGSEQYHSSVDPKGTMAMPSAWLWCWQLSALYSCPSLGWFTRWAFCKDQELIMFYYCSDPCENHWPERVGFSKLSLMGSLQAGRTSFTGLCPVMFIAWIPFIGFDIQSSRFHSKHISSRFHSRHISSCKIHRTTHCKHGVCVSSVSADMGFSPQPLQRRSFWLSTVSGSPAQDPAGSLLADPCSILTKLSENCFPIIFIHYWNISPASPEYRWGNWGANTLNLGRTFAWEQLLDLSLKYSI